MKADVLALKYIRAYREYFIISRPMIHYEPFGGEPHGHKNWISSFVRISSPMKTSIYLYGCSASKPSISARRTR